MELLARARRRCVAHLLLDQSALAAVIGMGGMILLLLVGTQVLDWYWVALLTAASLGTGLYRLRRTIPSRYKVAQRIDRRLSLADSLSTAAWFAAFPGRPNDHSYEAVRDRQREEAEAMAHTVDLREGVPFHRSRYAYPALGLALVAFGLFAVRYAVTGSLSLQPSLVRIAYDTFFGSNPQEAKARPLKPDLKPGQVDPNSPDDAANQQEAAPDSRPDTLDNPDLTDAQDDPSAQQRADPDQNSDKADNGDKGDSNDSSNQDNQQKSDPKNDNQDGKESKQGSETNSSLMDKLRDAVENLLNKMKPNEKQQAGQNQQKGQQNQKNAKNQKNQQQKKGENSSSEDQQQGESGDQKQSAESDGSERSSDKTTPEEARSGVGSEDGDKAAREAAALAAMGKISEIFGKRAQNVSGEVLVEVGSSKQQLRTPYAQRQAAHAEAGGEVNRDEVPLMYQQFVQQYFEEIRKAPASKADPPKAPSKP